MARNEVDGLQPVDGGATTTPVSDVNWLGVIACCLIASFVLRNVDGLLLGVPASLLGAAGIVAWVTSFVRSRRSGTDSKLLPWVSGVAAASFVITLVATWF